MILAERRSLRPTNTKILSEKRTRKTTGIFHKILQPIPRAEQTTPRCPGSFFVQFFRTLCQTPDPPGKSSVILHKNRKRPVPKGIPFETHLYNNIVQRIFLKSKSSSLRISVKITVNSPVFPKRSALPKCIPFGTFLGGMRWTTRDPKTTEKNEGGKT